LRGAEEAGEPLMPTPVLLSEVVRPAQIEAVRVFSAALSRINVEEMPKQATVLK